MTKNIVVLPVEVKVREFLPKLFLACNIVSYSKFDVYFGGQRFLTKKFSPKNCVWFDKFTYIDSRTSAPFHVGNKVIMQDEEGPISYNHFSTVKQRYDLKQKKFIEFFLFSGKYDLKMIKFLRLKKKIIKVFGLLKLELLKKKNHIFFEKELKEIRKKYQNFLFISGHSSSYRSKKQTKFIYKNKKFSSVIRDFENVRKNYHELIKLCKKIAILNPNLVVVFRKHPNEDERYLKHMFGEIPKNLKLEYKYSVTPWILACKYFLHSGCQTSLEAIALKKNIITYLPHKVHGEKNFKLTSPLFKNSRDCIDFFQKNQFQNKKNYKININTKNIAINVSNRISYEKNFINFIKNCFNYEMNSKIFKKPYEKNNFLKIFLYKILSKIKSFFVNNDYYFDFIPKRFYISKEAKEKKLKSISQKEIKTFINTFNSIYKKKVRFKKYSESSFYIYSK